MMRIPRIILVGGAAFGSSLKFAAKQETKS
jgi:hypothetical protein